MWESDTVIWNGGEMLYASASHNLISYFCYIMQRQIYSSHLTDFVFSNISIYI